MRVDGLLIPDLLQAMLADGRWPRTSDEASTQNLKPRLPEDRNRTLRRIYLFPPPFHTVARAVGGGGGDFYHQFGAFHELMPDATIEIADFGIGADTPILLDYRIDANQPRVIQLQWGEPGELNYWVVMASSFAEFVELLGL